MSGKLYLCATPIGNLEDMTYRVVRILKEADLIAAEDTRNRIKLLNPFDIKTPMTSYHEYNKIDKGRYLVEQMQAGKNIALVTDAGTPGISDPGEELVAMCWDAGITVTAIPGAAACITALTLSGLPTRRFAFEAFLPSDKKENRKVLEELKNETRTIVLYEAPHRLVRTLQELLEALGERRISVCRELTKKHETIFRTTLSEAVTYYETNAPKGECVLVLEGRSRSEMEAEEQQRWSEMPLKEHMEYYVNQGADRKEAMKRVAKDRGVSKRDIYQALLEEEKRYRAVQYCPKEKGIINGVPLQKKRTGTKKEGKGAESKADQAYFRNGSGSGPEKRRQTQRPRQPGQRLVRIRRQSGTKRQPRAKRRKKTVPGMRIRSRVQAGKRKRQRNP